jgi:hypothetical protein
MPTNYAMAKIFRGKRPPGSEVLRRANKLEEKASEPGNHDDPKWLKRIAKAMRRWGARRQAAAKTLPSESLPEPNDSTTCYDPVTD